MTIAIPSNHLAAVLKGFRILSADVLDLPRHFLTWNVKHQLHHATLNIPEAEARGFTAEGALALREIARSIRNAGTWQKAVTREQLEKKLASELLSLLAGDREPKAAELRPKLEARLVAWLSEITQTRIHAVPIVFLPQRIARFSIGPVDVVHRSDLASQADFGIEHDSATPATEEFHRIAMQRIDQTLASRNAQWVALVRVSNREKSVSVARRRLRWPV